MNRKEYGLLVEGWKKFLSEGVSSGESISLSGVIVDNFDVSYDSRSAELYVDGEINIKQTLSMYGISDESPPAKFEYESLSGDYEGIASQIVDQIVELKLFPSNYSEDNFNVVKQDLGKMIRDKMY